MKDVAFPTPGAQEALLSYLISIARDDKEAVAGVVTDFVRNNDVAEIERALPDPRMAAIAVAVLKMVGGNSELVPTPEMLAQLAGCQSDHAAHVRPSRFRHHCLLRSTRRSEDGS